MTAQTADKAPSPSKTAQYGYIAAAIVLAGFMWWIRSDPNPPPTHPKPEMVKGNVIDAPITLVTADRNDLACVHDKAVEGFHCEYATQDKTWESTHEDADAKDRKKLLAPYKTIDDITLLIPGLFEEPAVNERYKDEPPGKLTKDKLQRFTAQCKVKLVAEVDPVLVRWWPKQGWQGPQKIWMGTASDCQVSEP